MSMQASRFRPGAEQQTVVVGAWQDPADIKRRRQTRSEAAIKGGTSDAHQKIVRGDILLTKNERQRIRGPVTGKQLVPVFASLNNFGNKGQTKLQLLQSVRMVGVAGEGTTPDSTDQSPNMTLNAQIGGTITRANDGPDTVYPGDYLYWDIPKNTKEARELQSHVNGPEDRYTAFQRRLDPSNQKVHVDLIRSVTTKNGEGLIVLPDAAVVEGAMLAKRSVAEIAAVAVLMERAGLFGSSSGDLTGLQGPLTEADIVNKVTALLQPNTSNAEGVERLCEALGLINLTIQTQREWGEVANGNVNLPDLITRMFMPKKTAEYIAKPVEGRRPNGLAGRIYDAQSGALESFLSSVITTNFYTTGRVFAECLTKAAPGGDCHIKMGTHIM